MGSTLITKDGAILYYEVTGSGQPLLLVHGWNCSSKFWKKNVPELSKDFQVVTFDLRGCGNSSKIMTGHTIPQYAQDVRAIIEHLNLHDVTLVGWSMGGPIVLSYWEQYSKDSRLKALGLLDVTAAPFCQEDWSCHMLKETTFDGMNDFANAYTSDVKNFAIAFTKNMFKDGKADQSDIDWISAELLKTPAWIGVAIHCDFLMRDYLSVLPTITIPTIVFAANSIVFTDGIKMSRHYADQLPNSKFVPFEDTGHLLFYEQPERFNRELRDFIKKL